MTSRASGAVHVLATAPATPPDSAWNTLAERAAGAAAAAAVAEVLADAAGAAAPLPLLRALPSLLPPPPPPLPTRAGRDNPVAVIGDYDDTNARGV